MALLNGKGSPRQAFPPGVLVILTMMKQALATHSTGVYFLHMCKKTSPQATDTHTLLGRATSEVTMCP